MRMMGVMGVIAVGRRGLALFKGMFFRKTGMAPGGRDETRPSMGGRGTGGWGARAVVAEWPMKTLDIKSQLNVMKLN